jgi:CelD/BcsL family acetyltransferase involved in cellulose biosynthesis
VQAPAPLAEVFTEWDALAERLGAPPFLRPGWFAAWSRAFADGRLEVVIAPSEDGLAGVLPILRLGGMVRSPTNDHTHHFGLLAQDQDAARLLARSLFSLGEERVALDYLDASASDFPNLRSAAEEARYRVVCRPLAYNLFVPLEDDAGLSARLTRDVDRRRRRLEERGAVSAYVDVTPERLDEGLKLEGSGWKAAENTAILSKPATASFYRELAAWAAERGWLRLCFLMLDEQPIAFQLALEHDDAHYFLKGGYDPGYHAYSPGKLLLFELLARAREQGLRRFELLGDVETWKLEWANAARVRLSVEAFAPSLRGVAQFAAIAHLRPLLRRDRRRELLRA